PVRATRCLELVLEHKPGVASVYTDLARLYKGQENWGALVRILEAEAKLDLPPAERARCLKTAGEISIEQLGDTDAATRFFTRAADLAPDLDDEPEPPTPEENEALTALRRAIDEAIGPADQVDRILELVRHLVTEGRDAAEAAEWIEKVLTLHPEGLERWREVLACAADCEQGRRAVEALETHVKTVESGEEAAATLVLLGEFLVDQLQDRTAAIQAFQKALQRNPHDQSAVAHLERHWEDMGHVEGLTSLFRWQAAKAPDGETRVRARQKLTRVLTRDPAGVDEAASLLEASILENPSDAASLDEYVRLMTDAGKMESLLATLNGAHEKDPSATGIRLHRARTLLSMDKTREAAEDLEGLFRGNPTDPELWKMLVGALETLEDYDRLAGLKAEATGGIGNFEEKLKALLELGALYRDKVQSLPEAVATFEDALAIDPANEDALGALERIHAESERWSELVEVLERRAAFALDTDNASEIYLRIGKVWAEKLGDLASAASALEKASTLDPQNPALLSKLEETYTGLQDSPGLLRILRKIRETTSDPEEAVRCLAKVAEVHEKDLGDGEKALKYFREVLDVRPDHVPALKGVQRVCRAAGDDPGLAEALLREAAVTQAPDQRARLFREGGLLLLASDVDGAEKALREALALDPGDMENIEALERVYESRGDWGRFVEMALLRVDRLEEGGEKDTLTLKVARVLEELGRREEALALFSSVLKSSPDSAEALGGVRRIAEQTHSYQEAAEALRREIQLAEAHEVPRLHQRLGEILENRLHDLQGALDAYRKAAKLRPEGPDLTPDLERVMLKLGREEDVVHWLEEKAGRVEGEPRSEFLTRAGILARERLFDDERAMQHLSEAVEADPGNREARMALRTLLTRYRRWSELAPVLEMEAVSGPESERTAVTLELGQVCERHTDDGETAVQCYRQVLSREPENRIARRSLARVLRRLDDHEGLAEILEEEYGLLDEDRDRAAWAVELGTLYQGPLEDPESAIAWFENALGIKPDHAAALSALDRLYENQEMWSDLVRIWESILRSDVSDTRKKAICVRLGRLYEEEFSNLELALKCYKSALSFDPDSLGALRGVQRVARAAKNLDACRKAFEKEIKMGGEPARLALLHQGVGIILEKEKKSEEALTHFEEASRMAPGNREILRDLIQLFEKQQMHAELANALERWASLAPTGVEKAETLLASARVVDDHLKDSKRALDLLQRANAADGKNPEVLQILGNQYFARGDHRAVVDLLHQEIELVSDPEKKSRLLLRAAQIYEDPLGDVYKAAECLQEAVRLNPEGGKGLRALRELQGRFGGDVPRQGEEADPIPALLAEAEKIREASPDRAIAITLNVLDQDSLNAEALEGLVRLFSEKGEHRRAAVWLSMLAGSLDETESEGEDTKPSVFLRLGRLIEEQLQDPGRAVEAYFRAWELAPDLSDVGDAVLRLAPEAGRWEEYVTVRAASARDVEGEEKASLYIELATIEEEDLGNTHRAAEWVRAAMGESPRDDTVLSAAARV
ncbi:MAG: tetratricopeptide repeat protein, partial [Planctomycetota bacterium]